MQHDRQPDSQPGLSSSIFNQSLEGFDPYQSLQYDEEKAEELRNLRYGFHVANHNLLIDELIVCEVVQSAQIYPLPNTRPWVLGVINLRGNLVPVFDIMKRLDETATGAEDQRLLVLDQGEHALGIYIDGLPRALKIDTADPEQSAAIPELLSPAVREHVRAAYKAEDDTIWLEVDLRALFDEILSDAGVHADTMA